LNSRRKQSAPFFGAGQTKNADVVGGKLQKEHTSQTYYKSGMIPPEYQGGH
jgi:hypothetical protein